MNSFYEDMMRQMMEAQMRADAQHFNNYSQPFPGAHTKAKSPMLRATPEMFHDSYNSVPHVKLTDPEKYRGENPDVLVSANPGRWKRVNDEKYREDAKWRATLLNPEWETTHVGTKPVGKKTSTETRFYSTPPFHQHFWGE